MQLTEFTKQVELLASKNEPNQVVSKVCNTFGNVVNPCPFVLFIHMQLLVNNYGWIAPIVSKIQKRDQVNFLYSKLDRTPPI